VRFPNIRIESVELEQYCEVPKGSVLFFWDGILMNGMFCGESFHEGEICSLDGFFEWHKISRSQDDEGVFRFGPGYGVSLTGKIVSKTPLSVLIESTDFEIDKSGPDDIEIGDWVTVECINLGVMRSEA